MRHLSFFAYLSANEKNCSTDYQNFAEFLLVLQNMHGFISISKTKVISISFGTHGELYSQSALTKYVC